MMRLSEVDGRVVVAADKATTVGRVVGVVVDASDAAVVALRIDGARGGDTLHWPDITSLGPDAVMVTSASAIREATGRAAELRGRHHEVLGKRLLTDAGDELGKVIDLDFDERSGAVGELHTGDRSLRGDTLVACGSYAVVVRR